MRKLSLRGASGEPRSRRWDVVILGGALPGLAAAVRLGRAGLRVLIVEEQQAAETPALLREPFFLPGPGEGVLREALQALGVAPIDRSRFAASDPALQVLLPEARVDLGGTPRSAEELVGWGLAKPEAAHALVRELSGASAAELAAMLDAPLLRRGVRRPLARSARRARGLPELPEHGELARLLAALIAALSGLGGTVPGPEACARLLGSAFDGGVVPVLPDLTLRGLLRRRIETLHGDFRTVNGAFELVELSGHPGLAPQRSGEVWCGRVLLLNAPEGALARALESWESLKPRFLTRAAPSQRLAALLFEAATDVVPEALGPRAVWAAGDPEAAPVTLARPAIAAKSDRELLVARVRVADEPGALAHAEAAAEAAVRKLLPFAGDGLRRLARAPRPAWDDVLALPDPPAGTGWPGEVDVRRSSRPAVLALPREDVAALGAEGELLLGWRGGDLVAEDLGS